MNSSYLQNQTAVASATEQLKGVHLQSSTHEVEGVASGVINKENSKKVESVPTAKVALKPREFGRDVTNAAVSSTNASQKTQNQSVVVEKIETASNV